MSRWRIAPSSPQAGARIFAGKRKRDGRDRECGAAGVERNRVAAPAAPRAEGDGGNEDNEDNDDNEDNEDNEDITGNRGNPGRQAFQLLRASQLHLNIAV